jgi:hypothetical protein
MLVSGATASQPGTREDLFSLDCLILKNMALRSSETSKIVYQLTLRNIPQDWNFQRRL